MSKKVGGNDNKTNRIYKIMNITLITKTIAKTRLTSTNLA